MRECRQIINVMIGQSMLNYQRNPWKYIGLHTLEVTIFQRDTKFWADCKYLPSKRMDLLCRSENRSASVFTHAKTKTRLQCLRKYPTSSASKKKLTALSLSMQG